MARILIADDSASMRNMVAHTLESAGHQVVSGNDGDQALRAAKTGKFDGSRHRPQYAGYGWH